MQQGRGHVRPTGLLGVACDGVRPFVLGILVDQLVSWPSPLRADNATSAIFFRNWPFGPENQSIMRSELPVAPCSYLSLDHPGAGCRPGPTSSSSKSEMQRAPGHDCLQGRESDRTASALLP